MRGASFRLWGSRRWALSVALLGIALGLLGASGASAAGWASVTGSTSIIQQVGKVRAPNGVLHVVWARNTPGSGGSSGDIVQVAISPSGVVGTPAVIASAYASVSNPSIVNLPGGGLEVFFGAIQCTNPTCPSGLFAVTSTDGGNTWTGPVSLFDLDAVYDSDINAAALSDGTLFETWSHTTGVTVHRGLDQSNVDYDHQGASGAGCCGYYSNLAADGFGHVQLAWDSNATGHLGVYSQSVDPSTGAPSGTAQQMPGSVTTYAGSGQHAQMGTRTPIVALPGQSGQFFIAYPAGYPTLSKVLLWQVGSPSALTVASSDQGHNQASLAADSSGRLWVFWTSSANGTPHVFARRTTATQSEPAIDLGAPAGAQSIYTLDGDVDAAGDPEVLALAGFANGSAGTYYLRGQQTAPPAPPVLGKSFSVIPVSGTIYVKLPGASSAPGYAADTATAALTKGNGFVPLTQARSLPAGSVVDARRGTLELMTAAARKGKTQSGTFRLGLFKITQARAGKSKGLATLSLVEGAFKGAPSFASCKARGAGAHAAALSKKILQTLRASAHGSFRTRGRFSAGTVRGTEWGTRDRCDGTLTIVRRGTVLVRDFGRRKTIAVHAGHSYLARALRRVT